jgi:hypothetical protein
MVENRDEWLTADELMFELQDRRAGRPIRIWAEDFDGVAYQSLQQMVTGVRPISEKVCATLGYEAVTIYRPIAKAAARKVSKR